jgi:AcrR family transcriptional regulator
MAGPGKKKPSSKPRATRAEARAASGKADRGETTRNHIIAVATALFTAHGYEGTSIETVLRETKLSRGALYHHFASKDALFVAVLEAVEAEIAEATVKGSRGSATPEAALRAGCGVFLELAQTAKVRQILLRDAPGVIGWQKWRELDARYGFGLLRAALERAAAAGNVRKELVEPFAHMLLAALIEVALMTARPDAKPAAIRSARAALSELIDRLVGA